MDLERRHPDPVNALLNGEVDLIETLPYDLLPLVEKGQEGQDPGDRPGGPPVRSALQHAPQAVRRCQVRQAVVYALKQKPFPGGQHRRRPLLSRVQVAVSLRPALESNKGWDDRLNGDTVKARQLLKEAGYDGTTLAGSGCTRPTW